MGILIAGAPQTCSHGSILTSSNTGARILTIRLSESWHTVYKFFHINLAEIICYSISCAKRADVVTTDG